MFWQVQAVAMNQGTAVYAFQRAVFERCTFPAYLTRLSFVVLRLYEFFDVDSVFSEDFFQYTVIASHFAFHVLSWSFAVVVGDRNGNRDSFICFVDFRRLIACYF